MDETGSQEDALPVTVVVVNCNGAASTLQCLNSVAASIPPPERLVLVDNGSTDGSRDVIERGYGGRVPLTSNWLSTNVGLAAARNVAAAQATSPLIAFIDNDTIVSETWLKAALETMENLQADCVQCKLVLGSDNRRVDSLGYLQGPFGFPRHIVRPGDIDRPEYQQPRFLFGVKAAAMVIRRVALERAGGFDSDFFIYGEETDLCWRLIRAGGTIAYAPASVVLHFSGGTRRFLPGQADVLLYRGGTRNYLRMVAKNSPAPRLWLDIAGHAAIWLGVSVLQALRGRFTSSRLILLGILDAARLLPNVIRARQQSELPYVDIPRHLRMPFNVRYVWRALKAV